jgi:GTP-binding protein LepA
MSLSHIRNFSIIAHIDHGKSTLADRLLEPTGALQNAMSAQVLDDMDLGVSAASRSCESRPSELSRERRRKYILNLTDTSGYVDFSYGFAKPLSLRRRPFDR